MNFRYSLLFLFISPIFSFIFTNDFRKTLIRKNIDFLDDQIYHYLYLRLKLVKEIGHLKESPDTIFDSRREKEILQRLQEKNQIEDEKFIEAIWFPIFHKSKQIQFDNL